MPFQNARAQDTKDAASNPHNTEYIKNKLDHIIIPQLALKEATLPEAIEFLHKASVELDTTEKDPQRKGVNMVIKLNAPAVSATPAAGAPAHKEDAAGPKVTLSLSNIPLSVALDYVTKLAGMKYKIEPYAVVIVPISENTDVLITKEYKVPPGFLTRVNQDGTKSTVSSLDYLKEAGVVFPEGASASYLPTSSKLVVRNTQEQLDLVDQIVDVINSPAAASGDKPAASPSPAGK
ncbi:MAG TPA: hypothetical protein VG733_05360 [Chthoniobacteraceae bacterium]|nr:hypothetical protein [Chthoniobacteraceae bacterium]